MAITAGEYLTAVDGQMKLHGLTHLTKVLNSVGYTAGTLRAMDDNSLIRLLGADRAELWLGASFTSSTGNGY